MSAFTPIDDPSYEIMGDRLHLTVLASGILFAVEVAQSYRRQQSNQAEEFFDEAWQRNGFCVWKDQEENPSMTSHDLCFYVDTLAAILLGLVYYALHKTPNLERANTLMFGAIWGVLAHGMGHGAVSIHARHVDGTIPENTTFLANMTGLETVQKMLPHFLFWAGMIKAAAPNLKNIVSIGLIVPLVMIAQDFVPASFGFTYVQTVLFTISSANQLARKKEEKDYIYATLPMITALPVSMVGWLESTQCTAFVRDKFYGHLLYDATIPISVTLWYVLCYTQVRSHNDFLEEEEELLPAVPKARAKTDKVA